MDTMQRLAEGLLPELEQCFAEDHLAECEDCRGAFERVDALLYRGFSAEAHAAAIRREAFASDPLVAALRDAASRVARDVSETLERWLADASAVWAASTPVSFGAFGAVPVSGEDEESPLLIALGAGQLRAIVRIAQPRRTVDVEISGGRKPQLAILFDPESDSDPVLARFESSGESHHARFEAVPRGQYFLALSPF
jgi:hypothetical protein